MRHQGPSPMRCWAPECRMEGAGAEDWWRVRGTRGARRMEALCRETLLHPSWRRLVMSSPDDKGVGHDQRGWQAWSLGSHVRIRGPGTLSSSECDGSFMQVPSHRAGSLSPTPTPGGRIRLQASYPKLRIYYQVHLGQTGTGKRRKKSLQRAGAPGAWEPQQGLRPGFNRGHCRWGRWGAGRRTSVQERQASWRLLHPQDRVGE